MEPFFSIWLKELNPFQNITQRTEPFSTYDSKNWTFFSIELFQNDSKDLIFSICFEDLNPFLIWPKELTFFGKMTQIFEPFFNMTQRIDFFHIIPIIEPYLKIGSQNWFFKSYSKNRFFFKKKTHRIERIEPFLVITQKIELFLLKIWLKELNLFFSQFDSKNCSFFFFHDSNTWTFFTWLKELNFLFLRDSNTWTFFWIYFSKKWTLFFSGLKVFSSKKNSQNSFFFESDPQNWFLWIEPFNFLNMTQRIEPFNFLNMTQRFEPFFFQNITQRIGFFIRLKELNFLMNMTQRTKLFLKVWLKELNSFWKDDSKNWTLFGSMSQKIELFLEVCLKELNSFWKYASKIFSEKIVTQRIETFFSMTLELNFFQQTTQSTDFFQKYDSQNCNFCLRNYDSKNWTFLKIWLTDLNFFLLDSKNWTFFYWTQRIEHFFFDLTQKIEPFLFLSKYNSENWICFYTTQKKLNFFQYDSLNWTFFFFWKRRKLFLWI